jgi:hypothetical protein
VLRRPGRWLLLVLAWLACTCAPARADVPPEDFFEKQVRPLLVERCFSCHGQDKDKGQGKAKGGLKLTSREALLQGGDSGPAAVPGRPDDSLLVQAIRYEDEPRMPPKQKLAEGEIATLVRWVEMGLPWPKAQVETAAAERTDGRIDAAARSFWAFQPLDAGPPPAVTDPFWPEGPIDGYILAGLEALGLKPSPPADRRTLIRRATFDLTGLPSTPEDVAAFLTDAAPDAVAFARVVDRLLATPQYGERWGRHWLDVVRYADARDARGIGGKDDITEAWRYRDWVVDAFNRDLPYDQFIINQIAGDLIPADEPGAVNTGGLVATGLLTIGEWGVGDADKEKMMTDIADDQIDVVSRAFLGLTVACARCHDHKFDPIPTEDYYGLAGIFLSTHILPDPGPKTQGSPLLRTPLVPAPAVEAATRHQARLAELERRLKSQTQAAGTAPPAALQAAVELARNELEVFKRSPPAPVPLALAVQEGGVPNSLHAGFHDARVHVRGNYRRLGPIVPRHFPQVVAGARQQQPRIEKGSGRLELARWIARPEHPLTARVMVNRIWQHHFGAGIVRTPSNFGALGARPTHPALLDALARQFIASGWSIKAMHRAIMLSAAYRQSSQPPAETIRADPENTLFGRMERRRLESEAIRDSLLAAAGRLDRRLGGPATQDLVNPRRTLYLMTIRSDRSSFGPLFDAADATAIVDQRTVSTVAPQALFLLNHPLVLDAAAALARRIRSEAPADPHAQIDHAYALLFGRAPTPREAEIGQRLLGDGDETAWAAYAQVLLCSNEMIYID